MGKLKQFHGFIFLWCSVIIATWCIWKFSNFYGQKTNEIPESLNTLEINTHAHMMQKLNSILNIFSCTCGFLTTTRRGKLCLLVFTQWPRHLVYNSSTHIIGFHGKVCFLYAIQMEHLCLCMSMGAVVIILIILLLCYLL